MCGIAGVYLRDPNAKADLDGMLSTMLDSIEHRGGDATGFVAFGDEGLLEWQKASCGAGDFAKERRSVPKGTRTFLAHTRWATQGSPGFVENNHPLRRGSFFVIHNGHVNNDHKLFELAERQPYGRVDSEAIVARFASFGKLTAAPKVMAEIDGQAAIAVLDENAPTELVLARGEASPLYVLQTKRYVLWGSTHAAVKEAYERHIGRLPKKASITLLAEGTVLHFADGKVTKRSFKLKPRPKYKRSISFTLKETMPEAALIEESNGPEEDEDECEACSEFFAWNSMEYVWVEDDQMTYKFCPGCALLFEQQGADAAFGIGMHDRIDAEWVEVNKAILDEDAE